MKNVLANKLFSSQTIDSLIRFLLYVLIFWLPYSPAVVESCVVGCVVLWFLKRGVVWVRYGKSSVTFKERLTAFKPESSFLNKPIVFFLFVCLLSVAGSTFWELSLKNFFTKTLEWFIVYFLVIEVFSQKKHIYVALIIFMFTTLSTAIDSLVQFYITHKDIFLGHIIDPGGRATAGFKTPNCLGGYLTVVIPSLSAWVLLGEQKFRYRLGALLFLSIVIWSLIITFSRGAWVGTLFGEMFLLLFILFSKRRLKFYFSLGLLWTIIFLYISFYLVLANSSDQELMDRLTTIHWRLDIWIASMAMIKDKLLFGHGINTFMKLFQVYRGNSLGPTYAHNCYIQLAAETGLVGLFCFLGIMARMFHRSLAKVNLDPGQNRNSEGLIAGLLSGIFAFLVHSFFDTHLYTLQLSVYIWLLIGMSVAIYKINDFPKIRKV